MINNLILHNCILDTCASMNVMMLNVTHQLEMEITRPYKNLCGFDFKSIPIYGHLQMDLSYATNLNSNRTPFVLYMEPQLLDHVEDIEFIG